MIDFLRKLWLLVKPYKWRLIFGTLCGVIAGVSNPLLLVAIKIAVDWVFPTAGGFSISDFLAKTPVLQKLLQPILPRLEDLHSADSPLLTILIILTIPVAMLLRGLFTYLNIYCMTWVGIRGVTDLRNRLFNHLINLPVSFFNSTSTGTLLARINDISFLQQTMTTSLSVVVKEPVTIVCLLYGLFHYQPKLTLMALVIFPICVVPGLVYGRKLRKSSVAAHGQYADLSHQMHESFTATRVIKAYNLEKRVFDQFQATSRKYISSYMRSSRASEIPGPLVEFFGALGIAFFFIYIAFYAKNQVTTGTILQFFLSFFMMYAPIKAILRLHTQLEQARAASQIVFQLLGTKSTLPEPANPVPLRAHNAPIHFENISFNYGDKPVLKEINLTVDPGAFVALVGRTGCGKTTLTTLLLRFYDPQKGGVRIGGVDIREVNSLDLRGQIALVAQDTILFNDTIANNIEVGRPGATRKEIEEAARRAHAYEFIKEKPKGFDTMVGEKGVMLSGGQKQRISIARAILKNAPILILDEATNSLDPATEAAVQADLEGLMVGRTTVCVAHRLSTIQKADKIVVLDEGRIVEMGKHEELIAKGGYYRRLYDRGFNS